MSNLAESKYGHGAIWMPKDEARPLLKEVAMDSAPFDWNIGFDIENKIGKIKIKDQGTSGSCGGQATSYGAEITQALNTKIYTPKSAKFIYAPVAVPGGGSSEPALSGLLQHVGSADENLCISYQGQNAPSEAFMERKQDITQGAYKNGLQTLLGDPIYVQRNPDSIAQAIRDHGFVIIGLYGENNGTWLSKFPKPPVEAPNGTMWAHFVCISKAVRIDGTKYIGFSNSWGTSTGENGWQYLDASYMAYLWTAFTYADRSIQPAFSHHFTVQMSLGDTGPEVTALQQALKVDGEFPSTQICTGYFGSVTQKAVNAFQTKYASDILVPAGVHAPTGRVGAFTLAKLNSLFNR